MNPFAKIAAGLLRRAWPGLAVLGAMPLIAAADPARPYCSDTTELLFGACAFRQQADDAVAQAKCLNVADAADRDRCLDEAERAGRAAMELCSAQRAWRTAWCQVLGERRYDPAIDPKRFDRDYRNLTRPNPYFPLDIGNRWVYTGDGERSTVEVTAATKHIGGVDCIVVRDQVYTDGHLSEATNDWYAAGLDGSTWYFGEETGVFDTYAGDRPQRAELVSIDGSFKHARARDKAGIIMPAHPRAGQIYLEEFSLGNAEDVSEVLSTDYSYGVDPALDRFVPRALAERLCAHDCVVTRNASLLEPNVAQLKYYARGIGVFLEVNPGEGVDIALTECNFDPRCTGLAALGR